MESAAANVVDRRIAGGAILAGAGGAGARQAVGRMPVEQIGDAAIESQAFADSGRVPDGWYLLKTT
jgi:hypothetical protein